MSTLNPLHDMKLDNNKQYQSMMIVCPDVKILSADIHAYKKV